jgi:hypothetical protein
MSMPKDEVKQEIAEAWSVYVAALGKSLAKLEKDVKEAGEMAHECTNEWCEATEHVIDELANALFSISEPRWSSKQMSDKIKELKYRVYELYAQYRDVYQKVT